LRAIFSLEQFLSNPNAAFPTPSMRGKNRFGHTAIKVKPARIVAECFTVRAGQWISGNLPLRTTRFRRPYHHGNERRDLPVFGIRNTAPSKSRSRPFVVVKWDRKQNEQETCPQADGNRLRSAGIRGRFSQVSRSAKTGRRILTPMPFCRCVLWTVLPLEQARSKRSLTTAHRGQG
jgi:hypothetical protein